MKRVLVIFLTIGIIISCEKNDSDETTDPPVSAENQLNDNAHIVDTLSISAISENSITILKANTTLRPNVGDILLGKPTLISPFGFMRKVIGVNDNGNSISYTTEDAGLNDAFKQLYIDYNKTDTFTGNVYYRSGSLINFNFSGSGFSNGVKVTGIVKVNMDTVIFRYEKKEGSLTPQKVLIQVKFDMEGSTLDIQIPNDIPITTGDVSIGTPFKLPPFEVPIPIPTPVGVFWFPVPFAHQLSLKVKLDFSGKIRLEVQPKISVSVGFLYENSTWTNLTSFDLGASVSDLLQSFFTPTLLASGKFSLIPTYEMAPFVLDSLRLFIKVPNSVELTLQPISTPNYSVKYKLEVEGGLKQKFFTGNRTEYSLSKELKTKTIKEGNWAGPVITTKAMSSITQTTAISGGIITSDGGNEITARGVCWSTGPSPTITNSKTNDGSGIGNFTSSITGLTVNTKYYARAYATTPVGTSYGDQENFTTLGNDSTVMDIDSNIYHTVQIGTQIWLVENLKTTRYRSGDPILHFSDNTQWYNAEFTKSGAFCNYENNANNADIYGRLYNWYAVKDSRGLAPQGWHVPSAGEWETLLNYLGGTNEAGGKLKEAGLSHWLSPNTMATNSSGFTALPGGYRTLGGSFLNSLGNWGVFYSTTETSGNNAFELVLLHDSGSGGLAGNPRGYGFSVRCIKD